MIAHIGICRSGTGPARYEPSNRRGEKVHHPQVRSTFSHGRMLHRHAQLQSAMCVDTRTVTGTPTRTHMCACAHQDGPDGTPAGHVIPHCKLLARDAAQAPHLHATNQKQRAIASMYQCAKMPFTCLGQAAGRLQSMSRARGLLLG